MRIDIITIFPELFSTFLTRGMVEQARKKGSLEVHLTDLRAFTENRHRSVDDRPYGGGPGMVLKPEPVFRALELLLGGDLAATRLVLLTPRGERLTQRGLEQFAGCERMVLLCGRYEGFDERILGAFPWQCVSVGDYVLSGGEVPAMLMVEGVARLLPGVLGHEESSLRDSFSEWSGPDGFDHPHYTRPSEYRGAKVPEVLLSGNHEEIEAWRKKSAAAASGVTRDQG